MNRSLTGYASGTEYDDIIKKAADNAEKLRNCRHDAENTHTYIPSYIRENIRYWEEKNFDGILISITSK